jgi:hypothetical protein
MRSLAVAFGILAFGAAHEYTQTYFMNNGTPYNDYGIYLWPFILAAFAMVRASYAFNLVTSLNGQDRNASNSSAEIEDNEYIDNIVAVAALASRPEDIDEILKDLRAITARLEPGARLTHEDKQCLVAVYRQLETYFVNSGDPLRSFTREQVRSQLDDNFATLLK